MLSEALGKFSSSFFPFSKEPEIPRTPVNPGQSEAPNVPAVRDGFISKLPLESAVGHRAGSGLLSI